MTPKDLSRANFLELLQAGNDQTQNEMLVDKFRKYEQEFDPDPAALNSPGPVTRQVMEFIENGVTIPLSEDQRKRFITYLERLAFVRSKLEQE